MNEILSLVEERLDEPTAVGLAHAVSQAIREGVLVRGTVLPPIREIAHQLALSPTTVSAAWTVLRRSGLLHTDGRRGTRVARADVTITGRYRAVVERHSGVELDLSTGAPDPALLPDLRCALAGLDRGGSPDSYLGPPDLPELVEVLRASWPCPVEHLTVVDGAMDAIEMAATALLRFGDRVVVEHPAFTQLLDLLESIGARVVGVPLDDEGLRLPELAAALREPVAAVVVQPRAQNPTGVTMSAERAAAVARLVGPSGAVVLEDDSSGMISARPPASIGRLLPEQTVHVRGFSKSHGPDLRLAAMGGPAALLERLTARRQVGQGRTSVLLQRILLALLTDPAAESQVAVARAEYARRRAVVVAGLAARGVTCGGTDGLTLWIPVRDEVAAVAALAAAGIGVSPGAPFSVLPGDTPHIRVAIGNVDERHTDLDGLAATLAAVCGPAG